MIQRIALIVLFLFAIAGCGVLPDTGGHGGVMAMGDPVSATQSPLIIQCGPAWSAQIGINDDAGNGDGICFNNFHDGSTSGFVPAGWRITGVVSNVAPLHLWLCDHEAAGGGTSQPASTYAPGWVNQTTGHCYRTDGVSGTFYRSIGAVPIKSVLISQNWLVAPPACPAPSVNDTYTICGTLSDSGLPNVVTRRFGAVIAGTWPDGSSGAPCTGVRLTGPDQGVTSVYAGNACPVN